MAEDASVYATTVTHVRRVPRKRSFRHRSVMWVIDIDTVTVPRTRGRRFRAVLAGSFNARDHLDGSTGTLRSSLERYLAREGLEIGSARVLLAAQPRAFGFCFNPISVWWCLDQNSALLATVIEVHNTYGDRHAYLLRPGDQGRVEKAMYVSPFHGVEGSYRVHAPVPGRRLEIAVALKTPDGATFSASLSGTGRRSVPWWAAAASLRDAARIRIHGIALWISRLPVQPRPTHHQETLT